jgi:UDPglucose 6-dehydrogenase
MALRVTVIGTGYLGATHAACMAECGFQVLGVDVDESKVATLSQGQVPFYEPDLAELIQRNVSLGRLRFTTSMAEAAAFGDVHFLCVGTPQFPGGLGADLSQVNRAVAELGPHLRRQCLVVGKSTVPVGTAERLVARLADLAPAGGDVELAWNPEFLREGYAVKDTLRPDRIVVGTRSSLAEKILRELYSVQLEDGVPFIVTDLTTAELVKVAANSFLATKLSFINAMSEVCELTGANVTELAHALGYDHRIGKSYLKAGLGFGGGCLPKDIRAFMARAEELGVDQIVTLLSEVDKINLRSRSRMIELARQQCGGDVSGKRIGVFGAAFKPRSDDVRDSPALSVAVELQSQGAAVCVYDPAANANAAALFPSLEYADCAADAASGADVLLHLTEWDEFRTLDPEDLSDVVHSKRIVDGRNALDPEKWRLAGWSFSALGAANAGQAI